MTILAGHSATTGHDVDSLVNEVAALRREVGMLRVANSELERVVVRDTLTPLYNRRHFISCMNDRISRAGRYDSQSVLMLVDVDGMKTINDDHGHQAGDFVLLHIADILSRAIRTTDVAARIGGDEFALILDEIDEERAIEKMVSLDALVRDAPCHFGETALAVGASFGMAPIVADENDTTIIARADRSMYGRKRDRKR